MSARGFHFGLALVLVVGATGCQTPAQGPPLPDASHERAGAFLDALVLRHDAVSGARVRTRTSVSGATGSAFSSQMLLLERPARMRVEVLGLLGQRAMVLATDGLDYDLYRAEVAGLETGPVHDAVLYEAAGVPLAPLDAVDVLLATPALPAAAGEPQVELDAVSGETLVRFADRTFHFDVRGQLVAYRWHPGGHDWVHARYADWRSLPGGRFPFRMNLDFPSTGGSAAMTLSEVELNPTLDAGLFRLAPAERLSSGAEGGGE